MSSPRCFFYSPAEAAYTHHFRPGIGQHRLGGKSESDSAEKNTLVTGLWFAIIHSVQKESTPLLLLRLTFVHRRVQIARSIRPEAFTMVGVSANYRSQLLWLSLCINLLPAFHAERRGQKLKASVEHAARVVW